jgi:hypothetical protein
MKKYLIIATVTVILAGLFFFGCRTRGNHKFIVLQAPNGIVLFGDSAGYVGKAQYEVKVWVTNNSGKRLDYLPVFAIIKTGDGQKIGLAMGNTGPAFNDGKKMELKLETDIPKEMGNPEIIELYSEWNN